MLTTQCVLNDIELELRRYPAHNQHKSLQAWDSADTLITAHVIDSNNVTSTANIALLNDEFGALAALVSAALPNTHLYSHSDSWISAKATAENLVRNQLDTQIDYIDSLAPLVQCDAVLLKIPRSLALLEWQLSLLNQSLPAGTPIIAGAKVTALTPSVFKLFERYCGTVTTSLAHKKSRLLFAQTQTGDTPTKYPTQFTTTAAETGTELTLVNHANVFSRQSLDIGARVMLQHLPELDANSDIHLIDLGCGNGVLGLAMLARYPNIKVSFVDESHMALASAQASVVANMPDSLKRCQFIASNCLETFTQGECGQVQLVLCNPPFHQQNTLTEHIARQMFKDAYKHLGSGGELRVVANRHLPYGQTLKHRFGGFSVLASERKFVILSAIKRR
ncbi:methyltransferase [Alteromonas sp. ASW11-36]|uniref:Ribosomal RNA large subunit methyltransferase G n=1 Tax=Alteromonas arenosi TaxID=3055817 RepID=A0ABT7SZU2_9ALTE|nr:methyltransferase [Alteromonas sp. ASW11-36]MDM7861713.1 methyltransferase [Alteromonas sp. ASW11-36]